MLLKLARPVNPVPYFENAEHINCVTILCFTGRQRMWFDKEKMWG